MGIEFADPEVGEPLANVVLEFKKPGNHVLGGGGLADLGVIGGDLCRKEATRWLT